MLTLLPVLAGCVADHPQRQADAVTQVSSPAPVTTATASPPALAAPSPAFEKAVSDIISSNANSQNSINGLGANVGKLADKLQGFGGDLAHLQSEIAINANAQANLKAQVSAQAEVINKLNVQVQNLINVNNRLEFQLDGLVRVNTGLTNEVREQKVTAGHDAITTNNELTKETVQIVQHANNVTWWTTVIMSTVIVKVLAICSVVMLRMKEASRRRAEDRFNLVFTKGVEHVKV